MNCRVYRGTDRQSSPRLDHRLTRKGSKHLMSPYLRWFMLDAAHSWNTYELGENKGYDNYCYPKQEGSTMTADIWLIVVCSAMLLVISS